MLNTTTIGRGPIGVTGIAGRPLHDAPTVSSISGSTTASPTSTSTVSWTYAQGQSDPQNQYRVRGQDSGGSTTYYDSGWLSGTNTSHAVEMDTEGIPTNSTAIKWVIDVRADEYLTANADRHETSANNNQSYAWGNPQCTINTIEGQEPTGDAVTIKTATGITVAWGFSDGGNSQSAYRVQLRTAADDVVLNDSGWVTSLPQPTTYDIPFTFSASTQYEVVVQLKNNYGVRSS